MYGFNPYDHSRPYEQYTDDNVDDYIRTASYENDQISYGTHDSRLQSVDPNIRPSQNRHAHAKQLQQPAKARLKLAELDCPYRHPRRSLSLPVTTRHPFESIDRSLHNQLPHQQGSSSSPMNALPSSPTYQASQRQHNPGTMLPNRAYTKVQQESPDAPTKGPPIVQGIQLVPVHALPDRFQTIFPFAMFNAVQSGCFESIYESNDNCVFSSPTGSGKTVLFEIAICRMLRG
ncbi:P-loop containing nucleoside triphosphate hydrolase protein, partial [Aureobasidium melanogenum]